MTTTHFTTKIPQEMAGWRLDKALATLFPDYSRARLQQWLSQGHILVDTLPRRSKDKVQGGEHIQLIAQLAEEVTWQGQSLPLTLLYEDEDILVVNKPAGLVVHPGAGNPDKTLVNALLHHAPELSELPRAGIIHRLDKDTSGVLVVARSMPAHTHLIAQQQAHAFEREYQAIVNGTLISGGTIDAPLGRHPVHRTQMAIVASGKPAVTHYRIIHRYRCHTHLRIRLETGRTHQIRVHLASIRYPIVGDAVYGRNLLIPPKSSAMFIDTLRALQQHALHAERLGLIHPRTGEFLRWIAPLPPDLQILLSALEMDELEHA